MSQRVFTPKITKLDVHLGYIQVPLSSNFSIKMCFPYSIFQGLMILGIPNYEPWTVYININTMVERKVL